MPDADEKAFFSRSLEIYRSMLLNDVAPFWMRHGRDLDHGGISNVIDDEGRPLSHEKYIWSQGRALWTFSALYRRVERRAEWLEFATHIFNYLRSHGRDEQGRWMYRLSADGRVLQRDISIYVDGFVMNGMAEYHAATGNAEALEIALQTAENVWQRIQSPGSYGVSPYEIPEGLKTHGVRMIFGFFFDHLGLISGRDDITRRGSQLADEVLNDFYVPQKDAILEFVTHDGCFVDSPAGRACVPGHAIESLWFLISMFERSDDRDRIAICCRLIRRHLELAWDERHGGLRLALDIDGQSPPYWKDSDCRAWWVHVEALVATAFAYVHTRQPWCVQWHRRVQDYALSHFPVAGGEWTQWVDAQGRPMPSVALPVKDPFHLPRALIYLTKILPAVIDD